MAATTPGVRRFLVTGAQQGLGLAIVTKILEEHSDCHVVIGALDLDVAEAAVKSLYEKSQSNKGRVEVLPLDVTDGDSVLRAAEHVAAKFGRNPPPLYGILNNAGIGNPNVGMARMLQVNTVGQWRVCNAFIPLLKPEGGRVVNIASGAASHYLTRCSQERVKQFTAPDITWEQINELMTELISLTSGPDPREALKASGFRVSRTGDPYGASKALVNSYTQLLARQYPKLHINSCTPGNTFTPMTEAMVKRSGKTLEELGFHLPEAGARTPYLLMMGDPQPWGQGWYYGSDGQRSPLATYREPGSPPYNGPSPNSKL